MFNFSSSPFTALAFVSDMIVRRDGGEGEGGRGFIFSMSCSGILALLWPKELMLDLVDDFLLPKKDDLLERKDAVEDAAPDVPVALTFRPDPKANLPPPVSFFIFSASP